MKEQDRINMTQEELRMEELRMEENNAIEKYEDCNKPTKAYRQPKYKPQPIIIQCQKCGSTMSLTKTTYNGFDYWFCKDCIKERARELGER